jgi:flagellar biosynthesis protein FlhF
MPGALDKVREALGSDAVLLKTRMIANGSGRRVEITAALDRLPIERKSPVANIDVQAWHEMSARLDAANGRIKSLEEGGDDVKQWLAAMDFLPEIAESLITETAEATDRMAAVSAAILSRLSSGHGLLPLPDQPRRIALIGPPGAGKTTALVKLAAQASGAGRKDIALVNLDTYRPGAEDYLAQVGETLQTPVLSESSRDVQKGLPDVEGLILIDTDSRVYSPDPGGAALRKTLVRLKPDLAALVLPAMWRSTDLNDAVGRYLVCHPSHLVFSGLDLTPRYGGILSIAMQSGLPVACVLTTGRFDSGTRGFRPEGLIQQMQSFFTATSRKGALRV